MGCPPGPPHELIFITVHSNRVGVPLYVGYHMCRTWAMARGQASTYRVHSIHMIYVGRPSPRYRCLNAARPRVLNAYPAPLIL